MPVFTPFAFVKQEVAAGPTLWTPADNANLFAWYDAADTATVLHSYSPSTVSGWNDKSGNGYNASQGTSTLMPGWGTYQLNGYDVLTFSAGPGAGLSLDLPNTPYTNRDVSVYSIGRQRDKNSYAVAYVFYKGTGTDSVSTLYEGDASYPQWGTYTSEWRSALTTLSYNTWYNFGIVGDNATLDGDFYLNGSADGTVSAGKWGTSTVFSSGKIGNDQYGSYLVGDIAEIVLINAKDSTSDRQKMEGYLAWKWGLEGDLPVGHPYKSAAPTV